MYITPEKLDELIRIVHLAGVEIIKIYKKKVTKKYKSDNTPVTNADIRGKFYILWFSFTSYTNGFVSNEIEIIP